MAKGEEKDKGLEDYKEAAANENLEAMRSEPTQIMPVVAIKGLVMLPGMVIHFDVHQQEAVEAINAAMKEGRPVLVITQRDANSNSIRMDTLYEMGTISLIKQIIKLPGNLVRVMTQGLQRGRLVKFTKANPYFEAMVATPYETKSAVLSVNERRALVREMKDLLSEYLQGNEKLGKELSDQLLNCDSLDELMDRMAVTLPLNMTFKQKYLEALEVGERFAVIAFELSNEIEVTKIKRDIQGKVRERVDKNQKNYIMREQMKVLREELGEKSALDEADEFMEQLEGLIVSQPVRERIQKEIERYKNLAGAQAEGAVQRNYIETLLSLPWDKMSEDNLNLSNVLRILDRDHYGLEKIKERILEFLAVRTLNAKGEAPILCLVGPPGTGKTSIAKSVAEALNKKYVRVCLGGVRDEAEIRGHRKTYIGAMPGRIIEGLKEAGTKNPLMLLDEIDKVSSDYNGDTRSALLEVLDPEQNKHFKDHYVELPVDLSEVLFICTANSLKTIPRPLLDRMDIIELSGYTENEKLHIAKDYLYPKTLEKNGLTKKQVKINTGAMKQIISGYTKEGGVRGLERRMSDICRKSARRILSDMQEGKEPEPVKVTEKNLSDFLGKQKYHSLKANAKADVGIVRGLAWTEVGGDTLQIEVNTMPGKGQLMLTGSLGDVMKESAQIAVSYVRSLSDELKIPNDYFENNIIHIHVPEGATPKDGPSAGITMATAVLSAVTGKKVRADVAMTGEISLRGRVMPIGGIKEKLLAANKAGIKLVLIPEENKPDLEEISGEILEGMEVRPVSRMSEVLAAALAND